MSQTGARRTIAARNRQLQRESQRRRRELECEAKAMAKLSALEQARLEVETFENSLDILLSVHKEPREQWDWIGIAADLRPPAPRLEKQFELRARRDALVDYLRNADQAQVAIKAALDADKKAFQAAIEKHANEILERIVQAGDESS